MKEKTPKPPYYTIDIRNLEITSLEPFRTQSYIMSEQVPYYRARFGRLLKIENDEPTTTKEEAEWWLEDYARRNPDRALGVDAIYIDENTIHPLNMDEEGARQLRLAYKRNQKS